MKLTCKQCGYNRNKLSQYEDYECCICGGSMNEDKKPDIYDSFQYQKENIENETIGINEVVKTHAINSFVRDIKQIGKERAYKVIEGLSNARTRASYRRYYFLALEGIEKEV